MNASTKCDILGFHHDDDLSISRTHGNNVKGLARMSHQRTLSNYSEQLVAEYANYSCDQYDLPLSKLPEFEQNELARIYIEATGRETGECIYGDDFSINNDFNCYLLAMLANDSRETRENFAEATRKNIIIYYEKSLQKILDDACDRHLGNEYNEAGYFSSQDRDTGEVYWSKCS